MNTSKFRIISYGRVADPKKINSHEINVYPIELNPFFDGEIKSDPAQIATKGVDKNGKAYAEEIVSDNTITATWLPIGHTNRSTPPDVRRGERVLIWQYDSTDKYYWMSTGQDDGYRRLETVLWRFSNTQDETTTVMTDANSYWLEISTHKSTITLQTNKSNGEPYAYGLQFDCKNGKVTLKDDVGNFILLNSAETKIHLENADKSLLSMVKDTILMSATKSITFESDKIITKAKTSITSTAGKTILYDAGKTLTIKTGNSVIINTKNTNVNSDVTISKTLTINGSSVSHAGMEIGKTHVHWSGSPKTGVVA